MNEQRALWAQQTIEYFMSLNGGDDPEVATSDLLADIAHVCDREGKPLSSLLETANFHYDEETSFQGPQFGSLKEIAELFGLLGEDLYTDADEYAARVERVIELRGTLELRFSAGLVLLRDMVSTFEDTCGCQKCGACRLAARVRAYLRTLNS